jgi:hypothetical protein
MILSLRARLREIWKKRRSGEDRADGIKAQSAWQIVSARLEKVWLKEPRAELSK